MIVGVMKLQVATGLQTICVSYGDVLFRAWKEIKDPNLNASIEDIIQSFVHDAIHAAESHYFDGIRAVLRAFHGSKRLKEVDSLLLKVYGPILWRSLKCANYLVRVQASTLFFDAFPIQDGNPATSPGDNDNLLQRQFELQKNLLEDADHRVRAIAASGVCRVLKDFWEAVPPETTHKFLSYIAGRLGIDASSALVREAAIHGLCEVLDNPRSHASMKTLLPAIANSIHDVSERVRAGFVKILCKVLLRYVNLLFSLVNLLLLFMIRLKQFEDFCFMKLFHWIYCCCDLLLMQRKN